MNYYSYFNQLYEDPRVKHGRLLQEAAAKRLVDRSHHRIRPPASAIRRLSSLFTAILSIFTHG